MRAAALACLPGLRHRRRRASQAICHAIRAPAHAQEDETGDIEDGGDDDHSRGSGKRSRTRRPHLQGRFSGRLTTKEDERRLADECKLLGPLVGGVGKRGDKSRLTLAKIVRGIASGDIRRFCEERETALQVRPAGAHSSAFEQCHIPIWRGPWPRLAMQIVWLLSLARDRPPCSGEQQGACMYIYGWPADAVPKCPRCLPSHPLVLIPLSSALHAQTLKHKLQAIDPDAAASVPILPIQVRRATMRPHADCVTNTPIRHCKLPATRQNETRGRLCT